MRRRCVRGDLRPQPDGRRHDAEAGGALSDHAVGSNASAAGPALPARPPRSRFAIGLAIGAVVFTILTARSVGFSLSDLIDNLTRTNPVIEGMLNPDWGQIWSDRTRPRFFETLQLAVIGTVTGGAAALPLALWSTKVGNSNSALRLVVRSFNNVVRSIPDLLWALIWVSAIGIGVLPGLLALFFFTIAVVSKLTFDILDGIDMGPIEAADASGATTTQRLRTSVVPQILPAYTSFVLYGFELNLRASAVLGLVGAGGIGQRIEFFRAQGRWEELWGVVFLFFIIVVIVEFISVRLRRRLV
ncbi:MAG: phosphonate ABC transporter, permease protein PhnE [Actinomycetota bacterium]